jgi:adenylosuccinate lyase
VATTQVEPHDSWGEYFDLCRRVNLIVLDLDVDVWLYVSRGWLRQAAAAGEVGSSTMPHKVNPIRFENSEGNLSVANALLVMLSERLSRSRMQRDLSDSTVERNIGVALGHSWLGWSEAVGGLSGVELDLERCVEEISSHPELVAEPVQTLLRAHGVGEGYEKLRELTRGKRVTRRQMEVFLAGLEVPKELAARLRGVDVVRYVGLAPVVCDAVLAEAEEVLGR